MTVPVGYIPEVHPIRKAIFKFHPLASSAKRFDDIVRHFVTEGLASIDKAGDKVITQSFFSQIEHDKNGQRRNLLIGELLAECSGMLNAGSDTTSTALTNSIYLLFLPKHSHILERLRSELTPIFANLEGKFLGSILWQSYPS
jgi:benzoate 4-monooxygenase